MSLESDILSSNFSSGQGTGDAGSFEVPIVDELQRHHLAAGFNFSNDVYNRDTLHPLAWIFAYARAVHPYGMYFPIPALLVLLLSGRVFRKLDFSNKLVSLIISFMWFAQAIMVLQDNCPNLSCHVIFSSLAITSAAEGFGFMLLGTLLNRFTYRRISVFQFGKSSLLGIVFLLYTLFSAIGHHATGGAFFMFSFQLDAFTLGFLLYCGVYADIVIYLWPVLSCGSRAYNSVAHFGFSGDLGLAILTTLAGVWILHRTAKPPPKPDNDKRARPKKVTQPEVEPMILQVKTLQGAVSTRFKNQGFSAVNKLLLKDEDGIEAHEFLEATDEGTLIPKKAILRPAPVPTSTWRT